MTQSPPFSLPVFLLALSLAAAPLLAATPPKSDTPADYAYALPLQISGKQGVVGLRVPQTVYLKAKTAGLDDLRVFDAKGLAQPYALYRPPSEVLARRATLTATIFPVRGNAQPASGSTAIDLDIRTRPDGSVLSVQAHTGPAQSKDTGAISRLILDFGAAAKDSTDNPVRIEALRFGAPAGQSNYSAEVWLETSNDLKHWETIGAAELSWLSNDSAQTLTSDRLEFSPQAFRYARLSWRRGVPALFSAIEAETVNRQSSEPVRETLWIKPVAGTVPGSLHYPAGIALPVEQISLRLSEANIVYPMTLGYYAERPARQAGKTTEWVFQPKTQVTFYQITQNGQTRRSGPVSIGIGHQQEWVIRPLNAAATAQPELGLSWQPATLVFLTGGMPPYTLSFGRSDATPASQSLGQVAPGFTPSELRQLEQALPGELQTGHAERSAASDASLAGISARNRTFILWGVLLLGVVVLGGMAWRLIRQMRAGSTKED
jgi:hypothetical protein